MKFKFLYVSLALFFTFQLHANPCEDKNYLELKEKRISEMSEREYTYFIEKDKACSKTLEDKTNFQINQPPIERKTVSPKKSGSEIAWEFYGMFVFCGTLLSIILLMSLAN